MTVRGNFKAYGRDTKELRLMPRNQPENVRKMKEAFFPKIEGITKQMFDMLGEMLQRSNFGEKVEIKNVADFYKVASGMAALTKSAVEIERWEFEKTRRIEDVAELLKRNMGSLLAQDPELYERFLPLIDQAAEDLAKEYTAQEDTMPPIDIRRDDDD